MNKDKTWKIIAIISCVLLLVVTLTSFTSAFPTSQYYDICVELDDIERAIKSLESTIAILM